MGRYRKVDRRPPDRRGELGMGIPRYDWQQFRRLGIGTFGSRAVVRDADGLETIFTRPEELVLNDPIWLNMMAAGMTFTPEKITLKTNGDVEIELYEDDETELEYVLYVPEEQGELKLESGIVHQGGSYPVPPWKAVQYDAYVAAFGGLNDAPCIGGYFDDGAWAGEMSYVQDDPAPHYMYAHAGSLGYGIATVKGALPAVAPWGTPQGPEGQYFPAAPEVRNVILQLI